MSSLTSIPSPEAIEGSQPLVDSSCGDDGRRRHVTSAVAVPGSQPQPHCLHQQNNDEINIQPPPCQSVLDAANSQVSCPKNNNNETSNNYFLAADNSQEQELQSQHQFNNTNCTDQHSITSSYYKPKRKVLATGSVDSRGTIARNAKKNKTNENNSVRGDVCIFLVKHHNVCPISHRHFALFTRYFIQRIIMMNNPSIVKHCWNLTMM